MFNDMYIKDIDNHVEQFKEHITKSWSSDKLKLFEMYLMVLNVRRDRGECEDHTHYTHGRVNTKISNHWDEVIKFIQIEKSKL